MHSAILNNRNQRVTRMEGKDKGKEKEEGGGREGTEGRDGKDRGVSTSQ